MHVRPPCLRPLALLWILALLAPVPAGAQSATRGAGGAPGAGRFLPDSAVLARVGDRVVRVSDYVDAYFASYAVYRPRPDSLGRVEFLTSMVNKEVLALTALAIDRPMGFEDRATMRDYTERVLSNVLYRRAVLDSIEVTDDDVQRVYAQYGWQRRYRHIQLDDLNGATAVHALLTAGKVTWNDAVRRYSLARAPAPDGDMGWLSRSGIHMEMAARVWDLQPGEISPPVRDQDGYHIMQFVERRKVEPPAFGALRRLLIAQIREHRSGERAGVLQTLVARRIGLAYDTTAIRWAADRFRGHETIQQGGDALVLNLHGELPEFQPADTARVLARHRFGSLSLGEFLHVYNDQAPVMRQPVSDFESFRIQLDAMVLEPYMAEEARARGLERDPLALATIAKKREEILVDHLFSDSITSRVWISPAARRRYYEEHITQYVTYPSVRFASIVRMTRAGADSLAALLRAGTKAEDVLAADSLHGWQSGSIQTQTDEGRGGQYHKVLFGELRPGEVTVLGPDKAGAWLALQLLSFDPGRQLPYAEVENYVDESLQNIEGEAMLKRFIARHQRRYTVVSHPELVMRIDLVDPTID